MRGQGTFSPAAAVKIALNGLHSKSGKRFWGFCWDCNEKKPRNGGSLIGALGTVNPHSKTDNGPVRFTCADCLVKRAERKAARLAAKKGE